MDIYVKANTNCEGMPLTHFDELSPTWIGKPLILFGVEENRKRRKVVGYSSLIHQECNAHIVRVTAPDGEIGYLVYGGDFGLRIPSLGFGTPIIWIALEDGKADLPKKVFEIVSQNK